MLYCENKQETGWYKKGVTNSSAHKTPKQHVFMALQMRNVSQPNSYSSLSVGAVPGYDSVELNK